MFEDEVQYIGTKVAPRLSTAVNDVFGGLQQHVTGIVLHVFEYNGHPAQTLIFRRSQTVVVDVGRSSSTEKTNKGKSPSEALFKCPVVSRHHAKLVFSDSGTVYIMDMGSQHGTHILKPGEAVSTMIDAKSNVQLVDGDIITFGKSVGDDYKVVRPVTARVQFLRESRTPSMPIVVLPEKSVTPGSRASGRYGIRRWSSVSSSSSLSASDRDIDQEIEEVNNPAERTVDSIFDGLSGTEIKRVGTFNPMRPCPPMMTARSGSQLWRSLNALRRPSPSPDPIFSFENVEIDDAKFDEDRADDARFNEAVIADPFQSIVEEALQEHPEWQLPDDFLIRPHSAPEERNGDDEELPVLERSLAYPSEYSSSSSPAQHHVSPSRSPHHLSPAERAHSPIFHWYSRSPSVDADDEFVSQRPGVGYIWSTFSADPENEVEGRDDHAGQPQHVSPDGSESDRHLSPMDLSSPSPPPQPLLLVEDDASIGESCAVQQSNSPSTASSSLQLPASIEIGGQDVNDFPAFDKVEESINGSSAAADAASVSVQVDASDLAHSLAPPSKISSSGSSIREAEELQSAPASPFGSHGRGSPNIQPISISVSSVRNTRLEDGPAAENEMGSSDHVAEEEDGGAFQRAWSPASASSAHSSSASPAPVEQQGIALDRRTDADEISDLWSAVHLAQLHLSRVDARRRRNRKTFNRNVVSMNKSFEDFEQRVGGLEELDLGSRVEGVEERAKGLEAEVEALKALVRVVGDADAQAKAKVDAFLEELQDAQRKMAAELAVVVVAKDEAIAAKDQAVAMKDQALAAKDQVIAEVAACREQLRDLALAREQISNRGGSLKRKRSSEDADHVYEDSISSGDTNSLRHVKRSRRAMRAIAQTAAVASVGAIATWSALAFA